MERQTELGAVIVLLIMRAYLQRTEGAGGGKPLLVKFDLVNAARTFTVALWRIA